MRLRQLGSKQSITWVAPPEVHQSILDLRYKEMNDSIDSHDVIYWLLKQTCVGIEQLQPLYFSQGVDFCRRTESALINKNFPTDDAHRLAHLEILRCSEQQTLEDLYGPRGPSKSAPKHRFTNPQIKGFLTELQTRRKGFQDFGNAVHGSVLQEVEQEREVAFEVEAVRQAQKPVHYSPLRFPGLDEGILQFLRTGRLELDGRGWESASVILMQTVLGKKLEINVSRFRSRLFVSRQFMRTVQLPPNKLNDDFLVRGHCCTGDSSLKSITDLVNLAPHQLGFMEYSNRNCNDHHSGGGGRTPANFAENAEPAYSPSDLRRTSDPEHASIQRS